MEIVPQRPPSDQLRSGSLRVITQPPPSIPQLKELFATQRPPTITFHHPAYHLSRLFGLPAFDSEPPHGGLHHGTALLICGIIAGSAWDGWLSASKTGDRLQLQQDDILTESDYYFHVARPETERAGTGEQSRSPYRYPVVPTFQQWQFPHGNLPREWALGSDPPPPRPLIATPSMSNISQATKDRDSGCVVSNSADGLERAHICPRLEKDWYVQQSMDDYNFNSILPFEQKVDDAANALTLRADIHKVFDLKKFIFTRKNDAWVSHFLDATANIGSEFHNVGVRVSSGVRRELLLVRVAWAVFPRIEPFLCRGESRTVRVRVGEVPLAEDMEMTGQELRSTFFAPTRNSGMTKSRTPNSSKKRRPSVGENDSHAAAPASKRTQLELPDICLAIASSPAATPELADLKTDSGHSQLSCSDDKQVVREISTEEQRIAALRHEGLMCQRKKNVGLMCCNYNEAERAAVAGLAGPRELGGAHLCLQCLGVEYQDDLG